MLNCFRGQIRSETNSAENLFITYQWETSCKNLSPARNVCEAVPRSLLWASSRFNELREDRFELRLQPDYGRSTMAFFLQANHGAYWNLCTQLVSLFQAFRSWWQRKEVSRKKGGWGRGKRVPLPLFLLIFFPAYNWGPLGTRTIDQNHGSFKYQAASIYTRKKWWLWDLFGATKRNAPLGSFSHTPFNRTSTSKS